MKWMSAVPRWPSVPRFPYLATLLLLAVLMRAEGCFAREAWQDGLPELSMIGSGEFTWFGMRIYRASLWGTGAPLDRTQPHALQLHYYLHISRERLVNTSLDEIRRTSGPGIPEETLVRWRQVLAEAFVDVAAGDELTAVYFPGGGMRLYKGEQRLAEIHDSALAYAFFNIWLGTKTRDPGLRKRLLGEAP